MNEKILLTVSEIGRIINDVSMKVFELRYVPAPVWLDYDCKFAIVAYTHDLRSGKRHGNLYFELNRQLRQRSFFAQKDTRETWGVFMHYFMTGLAQLQDWEGECFRSYPDQANVMAQYTLGAMVQWGSFCSANTSVDIAKSTLEHSPRDETVILRLSVRSGRDIKAYAFFPVEGEVLLTPNHRFAVTSKPYEVEGYTFIDLVESEGDAFNP